MGNRYADDIRRIVDIDPNQSKLDAPERKNPILGGRGIAYVSAKGDVQSIGGSPGNTQLSDKKEQSQDAGEQTAGEGPLDPNNPQNGINIVTSFNVPVEDIIDGNVDQGKVSQPQISEGGLQYDNATALAGLQATDCDTGNTIDIRLRGGLQPPDGWDDANTPPVKEYYEEGIYWIVSASGVSNDEYSTPDEAAEAYVAYHNANTANPPSIPERTFSGITETNDGFGGWSFEVVTVEASPQTLTINGSRNSCTGTPPVDGTACPVDPPTETAWPDDNTISFSLENGQMSTSVYDNDVPAKYKNPSSKIDFCMDGGRTGSAEVSKDGGLILYETSGGSPTGIIRVYDSAGALTAAFDAPSGLLAAYRPKPV